MLSEEISKALNQEGFSQTIIAKVLGCSPSLVSKVINRNAVSTRVAISISKLLERPLLDVFPEYFELAKAHGRNKELIERRMKLLLDCAQSKADGS
tara:strand:+ start:11340 stop:11627 length:288 start_codon:yes stop_codon:yes gene_type:complete